jgi:DNA-binding GntR family transcriptional regulator
MKSFASAIPTKTKKGTPAVRANLAGQIVQMIDELIAQGRLLPGQRLVEQELANQLGVSRLPVREALRVLAGDGIVEIIPNAGARVRVLESQQVSDISKVLIGLLGVALDEMRNREDLDPMLDELDVIVAKTRDAVAAQDAAATAHHIAAFQVKIFDYVDNVILKDIFRRVHIGNYKGQISHALPAPLIFGFADYYPDVVKNLRLRRFDEAMNLFKQGLAILASHASGSDHPPGILPDGTALRRKADR